MLSVFGSRININKYWCEEIFDNMYILFYFLIFLLSKVIVNQSNCYFVFDFTTKNVFVTIYSSFS